MGVYYTKTLGLGIQDDDEKTSILVTAENFQKIDKKFEEINTRGFFEAKHVSSPNNISNSGVYYYKNSSSNVYIILAELVQVSPAEALIFLNQIDLKTGEETRRVKSTTNGKAEILNYPNPSMSNYGKNPGGIYHRYLTDQYWMGRRLYTALLPFTFVPGTGLTFKGIKGHVVRYEGILKGEFTSMGSLGGVVKQITLPYICTPFDNQRSAWLTFTSRGDENEIYMFMHGANSDVENAEGFVQIWYYDPNEESV